MRFRFALTVVTVLLILPSRFSFASTIHVPIDQPNIQAGIDAASNGDVVLVVAGTYVETIDFTGKEIVLRSETGADETLIDGNQSGTVVRITGTETVLDGFNIFNGKNDGSPSGGGIYCGSGSPEIKNCTIAGNSAAKSSFDKIRFASIRDRAMTETRAALKRLW